MALWAGLTGLPFAVVAVGALASRREIVPGADFALIDMAARRAQRWHQLLGVFDRYGWHHPGPAYLYVVSFLLRVTGPAHGAQAQVAAAAVIAGAAAVGTVVVCAGLWPAERRARAAAAAAVVTAAVAVVGRALLADPWNPYVVVLPLLLTIVLAVAAARGSASALAAVVVVGSFAVQSDIGTAPPVALALIGASGGFAVSRRRGDRTVTRGPADRSWGVPVALLVVGAAMWIPVLVEQVSGSPGNLTLLWRFFTAAHAHAGAGVGAGVTGFEQASLVGVSPPALALDLHPGWVAFAVSLAAAAAAVVFCRWRRQPVATAVAAAGGLGTLAGLVAGAQIVGPPFGYLLAWTVAPAIAVVLAVALAVGPRAGTAVMGCAAVAVAGLLARAVPLANASALADAKAAAAWKLVAPVAQATPSARFGLSATDIQSLFAMAGVADELDRRGMTFSVPANVAYSYGPGHRALPGRWLVLVGRGSAIPPGYRAAGTVGDITLGVADARPPGWA